MECHLLRFGIAEEDLVGRVIAFGENSVFEEVFFGKREVS